MDWVSVKSRGMEGLKRYKYILVVILAGIFLMALPEKKRTKKVMQELTAEDVKEAIERLSAGNQMQRGRERKVCGF